ncbi:hypothetical protein TRFO_11900 [Tritrichomonas foetus]|uniref:Uncharacterized protein n=1 Tax=Tritrichomonas foetus TaxID=1144522 RepID=A0A1J4J761_9EUKA|nr:hypothetical protein TRFO_11900 [Tritrichomonas foetus]|eukprot:OHS93285.1 hypothetical protein TRFO_11900 [Tritrichomonas foetus]
MSNQVDLSRLINSDRYQKVLEEVSSTIDRTVSSNPFSEPLLVASIGDSEALQLLEKEIQQNQNQFNDLYQIYQEIIEDTLYSQLELIPLEAKRDEMWQNLANSAFARLIERYNTTAREEAATIARYREELANPVQSTQSLQNAVYDITEQNKKLNSNVKNLELQLKRTSAELEQERSKRVDEISDTDPELIAGRAIESQISEVNDEITRASAERDQVAAECDQIKEEIEKLTEELVSLDKRSVATLRSKTRGRK